VWYSWALVRVVPRVERGEYLNVGAILFAREADFLRACIEIDRSRLAAFAGGLDLDLVERHLRAVEATSAGLAEGGAVAALPPSERFHWLTAPRSTVIQTSPVHVGQTTDPAAALRELVARYVRQSPL
jgi:hypothetical protein